VDNALGDFLRARRGLVQPEDVGIVPGGRRRVPGLRREELALLAGISSDYYLRLEQGRDQHPSEQVLDALAGALGLDATATAHLHGLARPRRQRRVRAERVPVGVAELLAQLPMPAFVTGRCLDVLASNSLAVALSPSFARGKNVLREVFLSPADHALHLDWDRATAGVVGGLRGSADPDDPRLASLVGELSIKSERFRTLWARADVGHRRGGTSHLMHPEVGDLVLRQSKFQVPDTEGQQLVVYHAEPGTDSAERHSLLGSIAVSGPPAPRNSGATRTDRTRPTLG
jgi:transcriptional regulator with XRE-family HTH domain